MSGRVVVLTGGVGGAKLALGLAHILPAGELTAIVNTGDDLRHLGLWISPDLDTLLYTLSGLSDEERGWGRAGESWNFMTALRGLGGEGWFQLGDGDLALHVERTRRLAAGEALTSVMAGFAAAWGVPTEILPMSDDPVATWLDTDEGPLPFQRYFVERRCAPHARAIRFEGAAEAKPGPELVARLTAADTRAILIAPSNPYLSVDPILAVPGIREALAAATAPVVAVSPLVGGAAIKGPTGKLMDELGVPATPRAIADHYAGVIDALLVDERDRQAPLPNLPCAFADTLMKSLDDRKRVARAALEMATGLS
ncbi:MAG: 2-phospho-L-lactate transferase [Sphingomonadales bacterium]|jgi:LPPG:FO 2-phospho-L-lactate transferase|nr:2-phospho-L-lactate transferase [Sphingomonadales bacterium]